MDFVKIINYDTEDKLLFTFYLLWMLPTMIKHNKHNKIDLIGKNALYAIVPDVSFAVLL